MPHRSVPQAHRRFGKSIRQNMTEAELSLWHWLRKPKRDKDRDEWLAAHGYRVVRVWNKEVIANIDGVCAAIAAAAFDGTPSRNR